MHRLILATAIAILAGCTTPGDLLKGSPTIEATTKKEPKHYALCVLPQWQEHHAGVSMNETVDGYRLISAVESTGQTNELLEIRPAGTGSHVRLYQRLPSISIGRSKITTSVQNCL